MLITYLQGTVRVGCSRFLNIPPVNCLPGCSLFYVVSKPTSAGVHPVFRLLNPTPVTIGHGYSLFISFRTYLKEGIFPMSQYFFLFSLVDVLS